MKLRDPQQIEALIHPRDGGRLKGVVTQLLSETGAILEGHFRLQSGLHSPYFARVGQLLYRPVDADALASFMIPQLARYQSLENLVCLASDNASGYLGRAIAKVLRARLAVAKLDQRRRPTAELANGSIEPGDNVLIVCDVLTTGQSIMPLLEIVQTRQATATGVSALLALHTTEYLQVLRAADLQAHWYLQAAWQPVALEACSQCAAGVALLPGFEFN